MKIFSENRFSGKTYFYTIGSRRAAVANGEETPIMDFLVFRSLRKIFGGRLKFIATGED